METRRASEADAVLLRFARALLKNGITSEEQLMEELVMQLHWPLNDPGVACAAVCQQVLLLDGQETCTFFLSAAMGTW